MLEKTREQTTKRKGSVFNDIQKNQLCKAVFHEEGYFIRNKACN